MKKDKESEIYHIIKDKQTEISSKSYELEGVIAIAQILTIICIFKGNPAWKGTLSILFFGSAFVLFHKFRSYGAKPYKLVGTVFLLVGIILLVCFGITV